METYHFKCSICGEGSNRICVFCTKDTCRNHMCERCHRCSDCCECETPQGESISIDELQEMAELEPVSSS